MSSPNLTLSVLCTSTLQDHTGMRSVTEDKYKLIHVGFEALLTTCVSFQFGRTEMILNCLNPRFSKKFVIDYYFEMVQKLKFCVYDIDNDTCDLSDDDFLGELECTLGQVRVP